MASFQASRKGKQRDQTHRFLCASVLCACCGRGGDHLLFSCQRCLAKPCLAIKILKTKSVRSGLKCSQFSYQSTSNTSLKKKRQTSKSNRYAHIYLHHSKRHKHGQNESLGCSIIQTSPFSITGDWILFSVWKYTKANILASENLGFTGKMTGCLQSLKLKHNMKQTQTWNLNLVHFIGKEKPLTKWHKGNS